jgi:hypothetical protein
MEVRTVCGTTMLTDGTATVGAIRSPEATCGTTAGDGAEAGPVPTALVAVTVNVYETPLVRPLTEQVSPPVVVQVREPGEDNTV